jgi:DNA-binding NarL/FixJ family response regulator
MTIRVLIADDQPLVRTGLRTILEAEPDFQVAGEAADGIAAVNQARRLRPDVILMDIRMPRLDGLQATRELMSGPQDGPPQRVIILTTFDLDEYVYQALCAGAAGFIVKDISDDELIAGLRSAVRGDALLAPTVTRRLIETYTRRGDGSRRAAGADDLTPREHQVWLLMARGLSNAEIAAQLFVGEATVKTHVSRVIAKLAARDRIQAIVLAYQAGLA